VLEEPVQFSATSQVPTEARHTVAELANASVGQVCAVPSQVSATSQVLTEARHVVPAATGTQTKFEHVAHAPQDGEQVVPHTLLVSPLTAKSSIE
jgi:hypothetical protein